MAFNLEKHFFTLNPKIRWGIIVMAFVIVASLDFTTPPQYILAYLYIFPILVSISFLKPTIAKIMLALAIFATLLNLVFPTYVLNQPYIVTNRLLAAAAIFISAFFMVRYIRYQFRVKEQENLLSIERHLAQVREDFIATLTHDLRTPLMGEQTTLQYLLQETFGPLTNEQRQVLDALQRGTGRQLELVQSLVSVYRNDNMGTDLQLKRVDMDEVVADILTELQQLAHERQITLEYTCQRTPSPIQGDSLQLKRVMANLIHNALNYTPAGGQVRIQLSERRDHLLIEVIDTGPGLSPGDLEQVFQRFYQSGKERQVLSTGLGLYLSRQIILAHRGTIWAENMSSGGCKFSFRLPIALSPMERMAPHG